MPDQPLDLYGFAPSVYVRSVRLALEEKKLAYALHEVDPFQDGGPPDWYLAMQPFGKIPTLRDGAFELYECDAILRYLEAAYPEHPLTPRDPKRVARMTQVMRIMDSYAYPAMVWTVFIVLARGERQGRMPLDEGLAQSRRILEALDGLMPEGAPFLVGDGPTLADPHARPLVGAFSAAAPGPPMLGDAPRLPGWFARPRAPPQAATAQPYR